MVFTVAGWNDPLSPLGDILVFSEELDFWSRASLTSWLSVQHILRKT